MESVSQAKKGWKEKAIALRKESQALKGHLKQNEALLNSIPAGLVIIQDGKLVYANEAAKNKLGYKEQDLLGAGFLDFVDPDFKQSVEKIYKRRVSGQQAPDRYETRLLTKEGDSLWFEVRIKNVTFNGRKAFLAHITNQEERKASQQRLHRAYKEKALLNMASGFRRELEQCLETLNCCVPSGDGLEPNGGPLSSKVFQRLMEVQERIQLLAHQLHSITDMTLDNSGTVVFDLRDMVRQALSMVGLDTELGSEENSSCAIGNNIQVKTYLRPLSPVEGRPEEIRNAIASMIHNSLESLPQGGDVYLSTEETSGHAAVYIQDTGVGIPEDFQESIFDPFFSTKPPPHSGLGLSLSNATARRHGGDIQVLSHYGQGSTFTLRLPLAKESRPPGSSFTRKDLKDSQILIAAEQEMFRDVLSLLFLSKGAKVTVASDLKSVFKTIKKDRVDVVFTDFDPVFIQNSRMTERIKDLDPHARIALIQSPYAVQSPRDLEISGVDFLIEKPLVMDSLVKMAWEVITGRR